jgi:hypothetical protein
LFGSNLNFTWKRSLKGKVAKLAKLRGTGC